MIQPETTKPRPIIRPNVCSVMPKMWISGCMPAVRLALVYR